MPHTLLAMNHLKVGKVEKAWTEVKSGYIAPAGLKTRH